MNELRVYTVNVEIVYINIDQVVFHQTLTLEKPMTVTEVLGMSGIYQQHPEAQAFVIGIFSKRVAPETLVKEGDRIEIYRPLIKNPKERRLEKHKARKQNNR